MTGFGLWKRFVLACLAVLLASSALVWYRYHHGKAPADIELDVRRAVQRYPSVEPLFDEAMSDGVLSMAEVNQILKAVEEGER